MKSLDEAIEYAQGIKYLARWCNKEQDEIYIDSILYYLEAFRDSRKLLRNENVVGYFGRSPIVKLEKGHFAVRDYVPKHKAWRCLKLRYNTPMGHWYCDDDDNYIINNDGKIICREVGWDLREIYVNQEGEKY